MFKAMMFLHSAGTRNREMLSVFVVVFALTVVLAATLPSQRAEAHGQRCFSALNFMEVYAGGNWHWYAHVPVTINKPLTAWHVHGPQNAGLWPDSVTPRYVKVFFSWPHGLSPYLYLRPSQFQACV